MERYPQPHSGTLQSSLLCPAVWLNLFNMTRVNHHSKSKSYIMRFGLGLHLLAEVSAWWRPQFVLPTMNLKELHCNNNTLYEFRRPPSVPFQIRTLTLLNPWELITQIRRSSVEIGCWIGWDQRVIIFFCKGRDGSSLNRWCTWPQFWFDCKCLKEKWSWNLGLTAVICGD